MQNRDFSFIQEIMPHFSDISREVLFGDIWERPGLSKRDRSLVTVAALAALYRNELSGHVMRALDNGVTKEELGEVFLHLAFYGGFPVAVNGARVTKQVLDQRKPKAQ